MGSKLAITGVYVVTWKYLISRDTACQVFTKFRQWSTQRIKDYLVQAYAINENACRYPFFIFNKIEGVLVANFFIIKVLGVENNA